MTVFPNHDGGPGLPLRSYEMTGLSDVLLQRMHQIDLGYTLEHDRAKHTVEELMRVGSCYLDYGTTWLEQGDEDGLDKPHPFWPQDCSIPWIDEDSQLEYIIKGAAFIAAALDLWNAESQGGHTHGPDSEFGTEG